MPQELNRTEHSVGRTTADDIRQLTEAGKELFEAGKRIIDSLNELTQRVEHVSQLSSRVVKSPWLIAAGAVVAGALILSMSHRES